MNNSKVRIAFLIDKLNIGGTERQLIDLINHIEKNHFEIYLYCLRDSKYLHELDLPCKIKVLEVRSLLSLNGLSKLIQFSQILKRQKIDIIQLFFFDSTIFGILSAKLARRVKIVSSKRDLGFWHTPRLLFILRHLSRFVDSYLVNSNSIKSVICSKEKVSLHKVTTIYNGIDNHKMLDSVEKLELKRKIGIHHRDTIVGIVANLNRPVKRVDVFIKAAGLISIINENTKFIIVGDGHLRSGLEKLSEDLFVSDKVIFTGQVSDPYPFISIFDIGVLTSDSEGFSNSIIEYMSCGIPIIATKVGGNTEIITHGSNGFLFDPGNPKKLSQYICLITKSGNLKDSIGSTNKKKYLRFLWNSIIKEYESFYFSLVRPYSNRSNNN